LSAFRASSFANASLNFLSSTIAAFGLSIENSLKSLIYQT
jgi:hypothetical protein